MTADPYRVRVSGPLAGHGHALAGELIARGCNPERVARHVQLLAQLSRWLDGQGLAAGDLSAEVVAQFLAARDVAGYAERYSVRWMVSLLGCVPGLAASTVTGYLAVARLFLTRWEQPEGLQQLTAGDVMAFVLEEGSCRNVGATKVLVTALRSLLRFLSLQGHISQPLASAVPAVSGPASDGLPRACDPGTIAGLLASCAAGTTAGRRDHAVLAILSRLGLRVSEVAGLQLEDIDWRHGELTVRGKGGREDRLPLPVDVGEALAAYLSGGRPRTRCRAVFVRVHAPVTALTPSSIGAIVARACKRAGVPGTGAHRLRHSAATAMLRNGASLAEIGQVLRQSRAATTAAYAKVDRAALRALALPWPGATP